MTARTRNAGLSADPLFVGLTRPPMRWGVTFTALLLNLVCVMELFVLTKELLTLLIALPIHGVCALVCARDARFFELGALWVRASAPSWVRNGRRFRASSAGALAPRATRRTVRQRPVSLVIA